MSISKIANIAENVLSAKAVIFLKSDEAKLKQVRQCTNKRDIEARSCNHCCSGIAISITYSECAFVVLVI